MRIPFLTFLKRNEEEEEIPPTDWTLLIKKTVLFRKRDGADVFQGFVDEISPNKLFVHMADDGWYYVVNIIHLDTLEIKTTSKIACQYCGHEDTHPLIKEGTTDLAYECTKCSRIFSVVKA